MSDKPFIYDWAFYYQAAYEKEKKKNTLLAGQIADAEAKEADLAFRLNRIQGNPFWKLSAPIRKCYHALAGRRAASSALSREDVPCPADMEKYIREYRRELFCQKHPYIQWIAKEECAGREAGEEIPVNGWRRLELEESDLSIIVCGNGIVDAQMEMKVKSWFDNNPECLFAYADEDYYWKDLSNRMHPWYKPCWSPDTLLSFCFMGHMIIAKRTLLNGIIEQGQRRGEGYADFYDLCLRLEEKALSSSDGRIIDNRMAEKKIGHIEEVLFHNCYEPQEAEQKEPEAREGKRQRLENASQEPQEASQEPGNVERQPAEELELDMLEAVEQQLREELEQGLHMAGCGADFRAVREAALRRRGVMAHLETGPDPDIYHVVYDIGQKEAGQDTDGMEKEMISVVIPSKDHPEVLEKCLSSFREKTDYQNYEWIVVDNGSHEENRKRIETLQRNYGFLYLYEPMEFNFSAMCNLGAKHAKGDYILLLNDDIEMIEKDWLRIMAGQAAQPHVGAVGAKLWYAGGNKIQHAGITNLYVGPSHKLTTFTDDRNYYYGHNQVTYDMIGVTAACLLIKKAKYWEVGGLDEGMEVAYNDVDFCFKLIEAGYYNVLRNDAVLYHDESLSRGLDQDDDNKWQRLLGEKEKLYAKHPDMDGKDKFYHKNLIDDGSDYTCNFKAECNDAAKTIHISEEKAEILKNAKQGVLQLTVDQAGKQRKIRPSEADIIAVAGWGYVPGGDNAGYRRSILLQREDGVLYCAKPFPCRRTDAERILTKEVNVSLAGFVLRFLEAELKPGTWKVGMLAEHAVSHRKLLTWSDRQFVIK